MAIRLAPFDPRRDFVAMRDFVCRGANVAADEPFDKSSVAQRTLRILYEGRSITYAPVADKKPVEPPRPMTEAEKSDLSLHHTKPQLAAMLAKFGVTSDPKWTKAELVEEIARARYGASDR